MCGGVDVTVKALYTACDTTKENMHHLGAGDAIPIDLWSQRWLEGDIRAHIKY